MEHHPATRAKRAHTLRLTIATALLCAGAAQAADDHGKPMLSGYTNAVGGESLLAGQYTAMLEQLRNLPPSAMAHSYTSITNLCVAYIATRQFESAQSACDAAIHAARREKNLMSDWSGWSRKNYHRSIALAYSNRAVLHWLMHDTETATQYVARAQALSPKAEFVMRNVAAIGSSAGTLAQIEKAPSS
jgi:hypothetical protein